MAGCFTWNDNGNSNHINIKYDESFLLPLLLKITEHFEKNGEEVVLISLVKS